MTELLTDRPKEGDDDFINPTQESDGRPKIHAKHLSLMVTAGTEDRDRTIEEFYAEVQAAISTIARAKRVTLASHYYILDGKVCLPADYDPGTQDRKPGTHPPSWAGGPAPERAVRESSLAGIGTPPSSVRDSKRKKKDDTATKVDAGLKAVEEAITQAKEAAQ
jgi:hypothetical protein